VNMLHTSTLSNLFSIAVHTSALLMVNLITKQSCFDIFTSVLMFTIALQALVSLYQSLIGPTHFVK
jgi:hypothetical protein